jgi:hypothetical protein
MGGDIYCGLVCGSVDLWICGSVGNLCLGVQIEARARDEVMGTVSAFGMECNAWGREELQTRGEGKGQRGQHTSMARFNGMHQ